MQEKYLALYPDGHHEEIVLGELLNKGGASGKIYIDATHPKSVAKIYHDHKNSDINRKKLEAMLHNRPNIPTIKHAEKSKGQVVEKEYILFTVSEKRRFFLILKYQIPNAICN